MNGLVKRGGVWLYRREVPPRLRFEDAAKVAASMTRTTLPSGKLKDFQPWKELLVNAKVLTPEEADIFQKLYNYFSNVGTHRLGSQEEHVRVAKNTVIEWGLLLVGRVQALPPTP